MAKRFAFLLVRDFTLSPLSLIIDTLRQAGDEGDRSRRIEVDWQIVGERSRSCGTPADFHLPPTNCSVRQYSAAVCRSLAERFACNAVAITIQLAAPWAIAEIPLSLVARADLRASPPRLT